MMALEDEHRLSGCVVLDQERSPLNVVDRVTD
jgi:hypothetical protein